MNRRQKKKALAKALTGTPLTWRELRYLRGYAAQTIRTNLTGFSHRPKITAGVWMAGGSAVDIVGYTREPIPWEHKSVVLFDRKVKEIPVLNSLQIKPLPEDD
jgi:hypothetical protein